TSRPSSTARACWCRARRARSRPRSSRPPARPIARRIRRRTDASASPPRPMFIPIRDHVRPERPPVLTHVLIAVNVAVFAWMAYVARTPGEAAAFIEQFGLVPERVRSLVAHPGRLLDAP